MKKIVCCLFLSVVLFSCRKEPNNITLATASNAVESYSGAPVCEYYALLCRFSQTTNGFYPPQVARAYGYVGVATYEAVYNGIPGAQSLAAQLNGFPVSTLPKIAPNTRYNWGIVSNEAIADMIKKMFGTNLSSANASSIDSLQNATLAALAQTESSDVVNRSIQFGLDISTAIYNYSKTDGGDQSYLDPFQLPYTLPSVAGCWEPTGALIHPISPYWGNNRPFIQANVSATQNFTPIPYCPKADSTFYQQALAVYNQVKNNTPGQVEIAKYWADDPFNTCTPTGHTFNIMTQLLEESNATLEKTSVAYAKLAIAENDAFIACWKQKYKWVLIRPVSFIKQYIDSSFNTVIGTPAFPAFTSGHSVEIGAASRVFIAMFTNGDGNYNFTDYSQMQYGFPAHTYTNFDTMAAECANSRLYGGIHYPLDNTNGLTQGHIVGDNVNTALIWPQNIK